MDSKLGLIIQLNGVFLITILSLFLRRSLKLTALKYWTTAWLCLSFALICLRLAFEYDLVASLLFTYYFLGEYMFGFFLVAGCKSLADDKFELKTRTELLLVPFIVTAVGLPLLSFDFNTLYTIHALVLSIFFASAFFAIRRSTMRSFGWRVMHVTLALLTVNFFFYFVAFSLRHFVRFNESFLSYNSIIDLVLQTTLGFGMVIVLLEKVLADYQNANNELQAAHKQLEELVNTDSLTAAFNRHAFYGFVNRHSGVNSVTGCVGFFDIDDLKSINDCYGHAAGDLAIRSTVRAIRDLIRAEDLIFRWGGDEFFVVMISMNSEMAEIRMSRLETLLKGIRIEGVEEPMNVGVSWGFKDFKDLEELEEAIKNADAEMYARKQQRKKMRRKMQPATLPPMQAETVLGSQI